MIVIKAGTLRIFTKIFSVNQVLITIRKNPVIRIKENTILDAVLQRSVPMPPLSSEYFFNSFLSVKGIYVFIYEHRTYK